MQQNIEFERCIDFLVRMIDKYGNEVLRHFKIFQGMPFAVITLTEKDAEA